MVKLMKVDGTIQELEKRSYSLEEINKMIGGYMASHKLFSEPYIHVFCNDDGFALELDDNKAISDYLKKKGLYYPHRLVGNMILFESNRDLLIFDGQLDPKTGEMML